jgi:hydrogenase/urease accessory protein HupE
MAATTPMLSRAQCVRQQTKTVCCLNQNMTIHKFILASAVILAGVCLLAVPAQAHDPGLSAADIQIDAQGLTAHLSFAGSDLASLTSQNVNKNGPASADAGRGDTTVEPKDLLEVSVDGVRIQGERVASRVDASGTVHLDIRFPLERGSVLTLRSTAIVKLARGHRQYLSVKSADGNLLAEKILDANQDTLELHIGGLSARRGFAGFREFLALGIEHILTGYDHLAFLLGLLIIGGSFKSVARIITSFTIAHSITLGLATMDVVRIPPSIVEPLIAASVMYVGLENIFRREHRARWLLTFGFGLVHGFGFASALRELGIGTGGMGAAVPLLSFNMGVELGQIGIAAIALPLIWKLRSRPLFPRRWVPAVSLLVAAAGCVWLVQRTLLR